MAKWLDTFRRTGLRSALADGPSVATVLELMIINGADAGQQFTVDGPRVTIGRGKPTPGQTGAILLHDTTISSEQATIISLDGRSTIEHNPRATNPSLVNGEKIRRQQIRPGDEIRMGRVVIEVRERTGIALSGLLPSSEIDTHPFAAKNDPNATVSESGGATRESTDDAAGETQVRLSFVPDERGKLTLVNGVPELVNTSFPFTGNQAIIGRSRTCDVSIPEPGISRQHCRIEWVSGDPVLVHMSQTNSTAVNGVLVEGRQPLNHGDEIQLADRVRLRVDLGSTDAVSAPPTEEPTIPPQSRERSLRAFMEEKIERDRIIEEEFSVEGSFLDIDVVGSYQMKATTKRPAAHIIVSFERFRSFVGGVVTEFHGQVLNSNGDELMCFFESTLESVRAASAVLQRLDDFNDQENELESPFRFRIGVHTGTSLVDRERGVAYSPVLDVAGHLQKQAGVNSLLISEVTLAALPEGLPFDPAGELEDGAIPVYRLTKPL